MGLDPETTLGLAKPYYENALALLQKKLDNGTVMSNSMKKDFITIYRYMAWFYYVKLDKDNAILYCNKILGLAPDNADAKSLIDNYNPPAPKLVTKKVKKSATATDAVVPPTAPVPPVAPTTQGPKSK